MPSALAFRMTVRRTGEHSGPGFLGGEVDVEGVPARRWLGVRIRAERRVVATVFSRSDGTWAVYGLNPQMEFDIIGRDWQRSWQDVIVGAVKPKPYE